MHELTVIRPVQTVVYATCILVVLVGTNWTLFFYLGFSLLFSKLFYVLFYLSERTVFNMRITC